MNHSDIAAMMKGAAPVIREYVAMAMAPLAKEVADLRVRLDSLPVPRDGTDGKSVALEDVAPLIAAEVAKTVSRLPVPQDGADGDPGEPGPPPTDEQIAAATAKWLEANPPASGSPGAPGKDGTSVDADTVRAMIVEEVAKLPPPPAPAQPKDGVGLASALIDRSGALVLTLTDGSTKDLGLVVGKDVDQAAVAALIRDEVAKIPPPKDGKDALGFDDMTEEVEDGGRVIVRRYTNGDRVKEFRHVTAIIKWCGVYREGENYERGDLVTWAGSCWHCDAPTTDKPGDGQTAWSLMVKKGRDGKEVVTTKFTAPVKANG